MPKWGGERSRKVGPALCRAGRVLVEEGGYFLGRLSDGDVITEVSLPPTHALLAGELRPVEEGREGSKDCKLVGGGRVTGATPCSLPTDTALRKEVDLWTWNLGPRRGVPAWTLALQKAVTLPSPTPTSQPFSPEPLRQPQSCSPSPERPAGPGMWGYLSLLPAFLALWATTSIWTVFAIAVANRTVNLTEGIPYISLCGSYPPQSCIFSQLLNLGAAMAAWICILRYHQFRDWGVRKWFNQLVLWSGLLCALGTSVVGNFQQKNQQATHLTGAFFALFVGNVYFWLQLLLSWRMKNLPQPGAPWIGPLRFVLCSLCTILMVTMVILHTSLLRSASAVCEWTVAMLLFTLFGLLAVDFSCLEGCTLCLQPGPSLGPQPDLDSPISLKPQPAQAL